jgi:hypothetical protein
MVHVKGDLYRLLFVQSFYPNLFREKKRREGRVLAVELIACRNNGNSKHGWNAILLGMRALVQFPSLKKYCLVFDFFLP